MRSRSIVTLLLLSFTAACGGEVASSSSSAKDDTHVDPPRNVGTSIEGSFDLTFTSATATIQGGGGPPAPANAPPSLSTKLRLDIRNPGSGYEAVLTSRWGTPSSYAVVVTSDAVTLSGDGGVSQGGQGFGVYDNWKSIVLARDASGYLTGAFTATGDQTIGEGDVMWQGDLSGAGTFTKDTTYPELRFDLARGITGDALLPWEPIAVQAAEPVESTGLEEGTRVSGDHGDSLTIRWDATKPSSLDWAGTVERVGRVDDWTRATSGEPWKLVNTGDRVKDLAGWAQQSPLAKDLAFLSLGAPAAHIGFDDDILFGKWWGQVDVLGGGLAGTNDPRCEAGGCMRIGPVQLSVCSPARAGFAAILNRSASGHAALRYRVLAAPTYEGGDSQPFVYGDYLGFQVASPGAAPAEASVSANDAKLAKLASPIDGLTWGTAWSTLDVAAPGADGPLGVAVYAGGPAAIRGGCGGPPPPPVNVVILVESISAP